MLLIFVPKMTNRLGYTLDVVMRTFIQTKFAITTDADKFRHYDGYRLCYDTQPLTDEKGKSLPCVFIKSANLLFETSIAFQKCSFFYHEGTPAIFPTLSSRSALPFDPFCAIFYMLSRYEEYLPHLKDKHGRFLPIDSIAYKHNFLQTAVVDRWAIMVREAIVKQYPDFSFEPRQYQFEQTIDIDSAYCYLHKGGFRTLLGIIRDGLHRHNPQEVRRRLKVITNKQPDPFDTFDYIIKTSQELARHSKILFFALLGDYSNYDKPISYRNSAFQHLLRHIGDYARMGIHGSYHSSKSPQIIGKEIGRLSNTLHRPIIRNRYHFLRFELPDAYTNLLTQGIQHDYSMGYATLPGFRCGTTTAVHFFDLCNNHETDLTVHPFATMDTTFHTHMRLTPEEAKKQYHAIVDEVRKVNGTFSCIFHNQNLCEDFGWEGWRDVYEDLLKYASQ